MAPTKLAEYDEQATYREFVRLCMRLIPASFSDDEITIIVRQLFLGECYQRFIRDRRTVAEQNN